VLRIFWLMIGASLLSATPSSPDRWTALTGIVPADIRERLLAQPASVQERWFAGLYLLRPVLFDDLRIRSAVDVFAPEAFDCLVPDNGAARETHDEPHAVQIDNRSRKEPFATPALVSRRPENGMGISGESHPEITGTKGRCDSV
jgi:hypothetical protein